MKNTTIIFGLLLVIASLVSPIVQAGQGPAPGQATMEAIEDCKLCHTNYLYVHHTAEMDCVDCHSSVPFLPDCVLCHEDIDHHENAAGQCRLCHENKQRGRP